MKKYLIIFIFLILTSTAFAKNNICIYVICLGKHSGIVIPKKYADISYLSNKDKYSKAQFIEYGFGDKEYYMSPTPPSLYLGARAVLWSTQSVIRVSKGSIKYYNSMKDVVFYPIKTDKRKLALINDYIRNSFLLKNGKACSIGYSSYGDGDFYAGSRNFYLFNTCNSWVAKTLNFAGFNISTWFLITRSSLENRLLYFSKPEKYIASFN